MKNRAVKRRRDDAPEDDRIKCEQKVWHYINEGQGGYKNVLYPDFEVAHDICRDKMRAFSAKAENAAGSWDDEKAQEEGQDEDLSDD